MVNKPDFCASGDVTQGNYSYENVTAVTSYSAPYVTGTIAQMMSRNTAYCINSSLRHRDLMAKASLMASCFYNAGTLDDEANYDEESGENIYEIYGIPIASDFERAGVINAGACYDMAGHYQYQNYTLTSYGTTSKGITVSDTAKPLRVAIAWRTELVSDEAFNNSNIMLHMYKEGSSRAIGRSAGMVFLPNNAQAEDGPVTNYQYLEIPASTLASTGAGNYIIKIIFNSSQNNILSVPVSLAWSQYVNTDA